jgi:hypothetical protein
MPEVRTIQHCRWAEPTLLLADPLWMAAEEYPWSCRRDKRPHPIDDTAFCQTCPRWESRDEPARRIPVTSRR